MTYVGSVVVSHVNVKNTNHSNKKNRRYIGANNHNGIYKNSIIPKIVDVMNNKPFSINKFQSTGHHQTQKLSKAKIKFKTSLTGVITIIERGQIFQISSRFGWCNYDIS